MQGGRSRPNVHAFGVAPGASNGVIALPAARVDPLGGAQLLFKVLDATEEISDVLCGQCRLLSPLRRTIVVIGRGTEFDSIVLAWIDSVIEVNHLRLVFVDQFLNTR